MNKVLLFAALLILSAGVSASSIRVADGSLIRTGDAASRLTALGSPTYSEEIRVCKSPRVRNCDKHNSEWGRLYQYSYNNSVYTIEVLRGVITRIQSGR